MLSPALRKQVVQMHVCVLLFYVADALLLTALGALGTVPLHVGWRYALAGGSVSALVMLLFWRRGARLGDLDPLSLVLSAWSISTMLGALAAAPQAGGFMLMSIMAVLGFAAVQMPRRTLLLLCAAAAMGSVVAAAVAGGAGVPAGSAGERALSGVWLLWLMLKVTAHNSTGTRLRQMVSDANARLADALQTVERLAATDELTALPNRRSILGRLDRALADGGGSVGVAIFDLDAFKSINDRHGHDAGDRVLRLFGQIVARNLRPTDHVGRYGGEEFLFVLQHAGDTGAAVDAAERVRAAVQGHDWTGAAAGLAVTVSAGVAVVAPGEDGSAAIRRADAALYAAKRGGRNRVVAAAGRATAAA